MEEQKTLKTPSGTLARMQVVHFGKIMFNMQFIAVAIMMASVLSFIFTAVYYILMVCAILISLFTLLLNESFREMMSGGEALGQITQLFAQSWQYTVPIVAVMSAVSIFCLCFDKNKKHVGRIVASAILLVLALVVLILKLVNGGVQ